MMQRGATPSAHHWDSKRRMAQIYAHSQQAKGMVKSQKERGQLEAHLCARHNGRQLQHHVSLHDIEDE